MVIQTRKVGIIIRLTAKAGQQNKIEGLSLGDPASAVGFSRSQLNRKMKAICNKTPNQLLIEFRLNEAKRMLEGKVGTVSEVAYSVGYSNMSYFTKSFKERFGMLPSQV